MAKSKISEVHKLNVEGTLIIDSDGRMTIDVEEIGVKDLDELLTRFNGENIKFSVSLSNDITE